MGVLIAILAVALAEPAAHGRQDERAVIGLLRAGKTLEGTLSTAQPARYSLALTHGQSGSVVVRHRGIDVVVRLLDIGSEPGVEITSDGPTGTLRLPVLAGR